MTGTDPSESPFLPDWHDADDTDLQEILKRHLAWIQSYVHRKLGDFPRSKCDTGDIVQEALIQFLKYGPRIQLSNDEQLRALLGKIVANVVANKYDWFTAQRRTMARERPLPPDTILNLDPPAGSQKTPSQITHEQEQEAWLRLGIELLEPRDREVIILYNYEDLSFKEAGKMLGISDVATRKRYVKASYHLNAIILKLKSGGIDAALEQTPTQGGSS